MSDDLGELEATLEDAACAVEGVLEDPDMQSVRGAWLAQRATVSTALGDPDLLPEQESNVIALFHRLEGELVGMFPYHTRFDDDGDLYYEVRLPWYGDVTHRVGELPAWSPHERPRIVQDESGVSSGCGCSPTDDPKDDDRRPSARVVPLEDLESDGGEDA